MPTTEALPAIRRIDTDRDDLCALEVVGHLSRADLENAYGLLEAAYAQASTRSIFSADHAL